MYLHGGFIAVAVERISRKIMAMPISNLKADTMTKALQFLFSRVDKIDAMMIDRGSENSSFSVCETPAYLHAIPDRHGRKD